MGLGKVSTLALTISFTLALAAGCSGQSEPPPKKTVFDPLTQQLQRAREVQGTVDANSEATRKAADAAERGDNPPGDKP